MPSVGQHLLEHLEQAPAQVPVDAVEDPHRLGALVDVVAQLGFLGKARPVEGVEGVFVRSVSIAAPPRRRREGRRVGRREGRRVGLGCGTGAGLGRGRWCAAVRFSGSATAGGWERAGRAA
jgi:hypothetical protein